MVKIRLKPETQAALFEAGLSVLSLYQPPTFRDGRKLTRVAEPADPWLAVLHDGRHVLLATRMAHGRGSTADEAILSAIGDAPVRLEREIDNLLAVLTALR